MSKALVLAKYTEMQNGGYAGVEPPSGPLDFHDGNPELCFGCLDYRPAVHTVLKYHGRDVIRVQPGDRSEPGRISAVFTNEAGDITLRLAENEWIGSLENWDIDVVGRRITVRQARGRICLVLRLDPPGRLVVERLDMRLRDSHVLVANDTYVVGRYLLDGSVNWVHARLQIEESRPQGAAVEFLDPKELRARELNLRGQEARLSDIDGTIVIDANLGAAYVPMGIVVASMTGTFSLQEYAIGNQPLDRVRDAIITRPDDLCRVLSDSC